MTTPTPEFQSLAAVLAGQYQLEREVGRGGMGIVYCANDPRLDRRVAIKTLPPHLAHDAVVRDRFLREARTAAALSHPNIVPVYRADEIAAVVFFVMGFVDGESLAHRIQRGPMSPHELLPILRDVTDALGYAHTRGVIHRDVKAENILIESATHRAMVTDFGIARVAASAPMTATGTVLGTVSYMSPEQVSGDHVDGRSDIYALGVLAFYALSGRFPFESNTPSAVLVAHVTTAPPSLRDVASEVPAAVADIVDRCLMKDPAERFEYAEELEEALIAAQQSLATGTAPEVLSSTEAHAVWERAAYLQEMTGLDVKPPELPKRSPRQRDEPATLTSGYQMADVRDAAKAVGIKDKYVDRALAERRQNTPSTGVAIAVGTRKNVFLGEATTLSFEAVIDAEMRDRDFDLMIDIVRRTLGEAGNVSAVGRSLHWTSTGQRKVQVSVLVRDGRTTISVTEKLRDLAGGLFGGIMGGGGGGTMGPLLGVGIGKFHEPVAAVGLVLGSIGVFYATARGIYTRIVRGRRASLEELTTLLAEQARKSLAPMPLPGQREVRRLPR